MPTCVIGDAVRECVDASADGVDFMRQHVIASTSAPARNVVFLDPASVRRVHYFNGAAALGCVSLATGVERDQFLKDVSHVRKNVRTVI